MKKLVKFNVLGTIIVLVIGIIFPKPSIAQTEKVLQRKNMQGKVLKSPYISYREYKGISLRIKKNYSELGKKVSKKKVKFKKIISASSIGYIINILGKPKSIERRKFSENKRLSAKLNYEGVIIEYERYRGEKSGITTIEIRSPNWSLRVGETELHPSMKVDKLSSPVRNSLKEDTTFDKPTLDSFGVIHIAKPDSGKHGQVELVQEGKAKITVHVNDETRTVEMVRFTRLGP